MFSPLQKEEEEGEKSGGEEDVPEATERKEHASCGQTGVDSVQSIQAAELAGAAPEKEQGKEVRPRPQCLSETMFSWAGCCIWFLLSFVIVDI